jgi:hypothetical protein
VAAYNEPHIIHFDTAFFKNNNNKSNLIEISSDSEDTTESGSDSGSESGSQGESSESAGSDSSSSSDSSSESSDSDSSDADRDSEPMNLGVVSDIIEVVCEPEPISDIKLVTVDLGAMHESPQPLSVSVRSSSPPPPHSQEDIEVMETTVAPPPAPAPAPASAPSLSSMSVPELRHLLKEKYKNNPEKHPEIQKLKKVELIYALQQTTQ